MDPKKLLGIVDSLHREKNIDEEIVFEAIEAALVTAAKRYYGDEKDIHFTINRAEGAIIGSCDGEPLDFAETIGRIGAQQAKQVIIQKVREAERDAVYGEYKEREDELVNGVVQRTERGTTTVSLGSLEAILPRSEQIPGETHHANERVRAVICDVRKEGNRVKVVLSRTRPKLVLRLFEQEIPEINDGVIVVNGIAREPGYRSKVAVSSGDQRVDCVGACVGVRGNRIKNIVDELAGERIDIVRWSDDPQVLIPNALQPAEVDEVILCQMMGRAIVLVREDQLSLAIGRRGQNVRLASKLCGVDIEIMTQEELEAQIDRAITGFSEIPGVDEDLANRLVGEGFLSYDDLSVIEPDDLMEMADLTMEQVEAIVEEAEIRAEEAERVAAEERRRQKELQQQAQLQAQIQAQLPTPTLDQVIEAAKSETKSPQESGPEGDDLLEESSTEASSQPAGAETPLTESKAPEAEATEAEATEAEATEAEATEAEAPEAEAPEAEGPEAEGPEAEEVEAVDGPVTENDNVQTSDVADVESPTVESDDSHPSPTSESSIAGEDNGKDSKMEGEPSDEDSHNHIPSDAMAEPTPETVPAEPHGREEAR